MSDILMAGMAGSEDLAGVAVGGAFYTLTAVFLLGFVSALHPLLAARHGSGSHALIAATAAAALRATLAACAVLMLVLTICCCAILTPLSASRMHEVSRGYVLCITLALPFLGIFYVLRSCCEALSVTRVSLYCGLWALACNVPLNYLFIFGGGCIPAAGGVGCGIATLLSLMFTAAMLTFYIRCHPALGLRCLWSSAMRGAGQGLEFARRGLILGLAMSFEESCFTLIAVLLAPLGAAVVAGHAIMLSLAALLCNLPLALGIALSVMVGHAHGAKDRRRLLDCLQAGYQAALLCAVLSSALLGACGERLIALFSADPEVCAAARGLLGICIFNQLWENLQTTASFMLRGMGDSRSIFWVSLLAFLGIGLGGGWLLCYAPGSPCSGARGFWVALAAALFASALSYALRMRRLLRSAAVADLAGRSPQDSGRGI